MRYHDFMSPKPTKAQLEALVFAAEQPTGVLSSDSRTEVFLASSVLPSSFRAGASIRFDTVSALERRGWAEKTWHSGSMWMFAITETGREVSKAEVERRAVERRARQEKADAIDADKEAEREREERSLRARRASEPHRRPMLIPSPEPTEPVSEHQSDALKNEAVEAFLLAIDGHPDPRRSGAALDAAFDVLVGLFDEAARSWCASDVERQAFPETAATLRALAPFRTCAEVAAFTAQTEEICSEMYRLAEQTGDEHVASGARYNLDRLAAVARSFKDQTPWNLFCAARSLGEIARATLHQDAARRALVRLMLPSAEGDAS